MRQGARVTFVSVVTAGLVMGGAGMANAATSTEDAVVPSCLQQATKQTLHDPVGTVVADVEGATKDPKGFLAAEAECVLSALPS